MSPNDRTIRDRNVDIEVDSEAGIETSLVGNLLRRRSPRGYFTSPSSAMSDSQESSVEKTFQDNRQQIDFQQQGRSDSLSVDIGSTADAIFEEKNDPALDLTETESTSSGNGESQHKAQMHPTQELDTAPIIIPEPSSTNDCSKSPSNSSPPKSESSMSLSQLPSLPRNFQSQQFFQVSASSYRAPTKLHELCVKAKTTEDLMQARSVLLGLKLERKEILGWSGVRDDRGQTPMHLLADNKVLSEFIIHGGNQTPRNDDSGFFPGLENVNPTSFDEGIQPREVAATNFIVDFLLAASPSCIMSRDANGNIPFEAAIARWINEGYDEMLQDQDRASQNSRRRDSLPQAANKAVRHALRSSMHFATKKTMDSIRKSSGQPVDESLAGTSSSGNTPHPSKKLSGLSRRGTYVGMPKEIARHRCFPVNISLTNQAKFAFKMLSNIIERLEHLSCTQKNATRFKSNAAQSPDALQEIDSFDRAIEAKIIDVCAYDEIKDAVILSIASIPDFIKTIFLIDNEEEHRFVLSTTIVRRVLMSKHSVGIWLTSMLQSGDKVVVSRAVEYLKCVSEVTAAEIPNMNPNNSSSGMGQADKCRGGVHNEISRLKDFVPSLLSLGENEMEEAAISMVVRRVMDKIIARPFALTIILCDALFLTLLIIGFRSAVDELLVRGDENKVMRGLYLANTGIFYFLIRELGKAISLCMITRRARVYLWSFWNLTDIAATVMALASVIAIRSTSDSDEDFDIVEKHGLRDFLAVTTGFLWLRVLNMMKGINMQMATFILAILQITKDTLSFGIILCAMVICFGQMFYTILIPDYCAAEADESEENLDYQCDQSEYTFRVYTILLGEFASFESENFQTTFSVFLLVIYSFMVIIVLMNVLIALASDSYEKCLMKSQMLFGRARVMLVAEIGCLQNLLRKTPSQADSSSASALYTSNPKVFDKWWSNAPACAKGWSRGSVIFFCLSSAVILCWIIGELAGYASGERHGNIAMSMASVLANAVLFACMMGFLSHHGAQETDCASMRSSLSSPMQSTDSDRSGVPTSIQNLLLRIMGSSDDSWNHVRKRNQKQESMWQGRVHFIQSQMEQRAQEARELAAKQTQALEKLVTATELRLKNDMADVEHEVGDLKADLLKEMRESQAEMLRQIQVCLSQPGK